MTFCVPNCNGRPSWFSQKPATMIILLLSWHYASCGQNRNHILRSIQLETIFSNGQILFLLEIFIELRVDSRHLPERSDPRHSVTTSRREEVVRHTRSQSVAANGFRCD